MITESVLSFLSGGVFTTAKDLIINIIQYIFRFIFNIVELLLTPLLSRILVNIPFLDDLSDKLNYIFNFISPYINYILDTLFISQPILVYLVISLIGRIVIKNGSYIIKMLIQWYEKIVP